MSRTTPIRVRLTEAEEARYKQLAVDGGVDFSSWARAAFEEKAARNGGFRGSSRVATAGGRPEPTREGGSPPLPAAPTTVTLDVASPSAHPAVCRCRGCLEAA